MLYSHLQKGSCGASPTRFTYYVRDRVFSWLYSTEKLATGSMYLHQAAQPP